MGNVGYADFQRFGFRGVSAVDDCVFQTAVRKESHRPLDSERDWVVSMGVYIKGIEMPKNCARCFVGDRTICHDKCPLVHVPPHGDLIERKTAYDSLLNGMAMTGYQSRALDCISDFYVPTIIPAEEGRS